MERLLSRQYLVQRNEYDVYSDELGFCVLSIPVDIDPEIESFTVPHNLLLLMQISFLCIPLSDRRQLVM